MRLLLLIVLVFPFFSYSSSDELFLRTSEIRWPRPSSAVDACQKSVPQSQVESEAKASCSAWTPKGIYVRHSVSTTSTTTECIATAKTYCAYLNSPCATPKTDDQCSKGKTGTITGNAVFWATGNYKGCTFTAADGVFIKLADGTMTGDATSTGSTGKTWCSATDSSYNPADDEALSKNPAFSPAKDNDPKNCKNGWVQAGGGKFHCLNDTSGNVDAPPDKVNPEDGSINSDKDGKPKPPDAGVGKPPAGDGAGGDGGGGSGGDGGGGDCEGEDCEGGGGGTKPPVRPADPWSDILDAADVARVKADTQSVQDELADFYRSAASGFQININKPAAGAMPSYGDITQGGQKISLSMSWLDKISFADGRAGVLVLCSLIAAYIILVRR
ncbi:hypothetical protein GBN32_01585 [Plesiomonas shigelloides]|uniref:hypothetical protein n=1 Tax=Plesiomonas shigelloides TaxID=703 RepID=UPI001261F34C|nr:hypothetical protein [Plesiomonas shigelloides]KAB7715005.1 hypothetical protein GBN32_01585 [Plesiomonas shigelloides]